MRWLNLKIGPQIFLSFSLAAVLTVVVAGVSIYYLRGVGERLTTVAEQDRLLQTSALEMRVAVERESDGVLSYLLSGDKTFLEQLAVGSSYYSGTAAKLQELVQSEEDRELLAEIDTLHGRFLDIAEEQITLREQGFPRAATFLWRTQGSDIKGDLDSSFTDFNTRQEEAISQRVRDAKKEQNLALAISLGVVGLAWLVGIVGGIWVSRSITNPIRSLVSAAQAIGRGDLSIRTSISGRDELALLGSAINQMTNDLDQSRMTMENILQQEQRRAEQMRAINEIATQISSVLRMDELLPYVTNLLRDNFGYYGVGIFLLEPGSDSLVLRAIAGGVEDAIPIDRRVEQGEESIVEWVAKTGKPLLANDVSKELRYRFVEHWRDTRAELAVPITVGDQVVGVLDIQSSDPDAFDETDQFTAQTLAHCLAVAIENARLFQQTRELVVLEERNRLAREIHDTLAQGFTGIVLQLEAAEQALEESPAEVPDHLSRAKNLARESLQEARRSVWDLLPRALEQLTLDAALQGEVLRFAAEGGGEASFSLSGEQRELPSNVQAALLRICQESLTNVRRHAEATEVKVSLTFSPKAVCLSVQDNGIGFDFQKVKTLGRNRGFGLTGMEQRVRLLEGGLAVKSRKGEGTLVEVRIPTA